MISQDISLDEYRTFLAVAKAGGFAKADADLGLSQATISKRIISLEAALGVPLFERRGARPIILTEAGRQLRKLLEPLIAAALELPVRLGQLLTGRTSNLRIVTGQTDAVSHMPLVISTFSKRYPTVHLQVRVARSAEILDLVDRAEVNLGLTTRPLRHAAGLVLLPIRSQSLVAVMAPGHPLDERRRLKLADLSGVGLIVPDGASYVRSTIDAAFLREKLLPTVAIEAGGWEAIKAYAALGCGVGLVASGSVNPADKSLVSLPVTPGIAPVQTGVVLRDEALDDRVVCEFVQVLYKCFGAKAPAAVLERGA